jgi:hypothetical protein
MDQTGSASSCAAVVVLIAAKRRAVAEPALAALRGAGHEVAVRSRLPPRAVAGWRAAPQHLVVVIDTQSYLSGHTTEVYEGILAGCAALRRQRRGPTSVITVFPDPGAAIAHIVGIGRIVTASAGPWSEGDSVPRMVAEVVQRVATYPQGGP